MAGARVMMEMMVTMEVTVNVLLEQSFVMTACVDMSICVNEDIVW